ncbi:MAG: N(5)-(carboxyethyl)ornithine synthase [Lactobacillales bacterium]|jgi:N5-(carboxyethyl)ornithine synthase|nr:N(5)-(carboxyethyl)ornithine synthase [Lactobacillales bacterium]
MDALKTLGFVNSHKEDEQRIALLPKDLAEVKNRELIYFEKGYGNRLGIADEEYLALGAHITSREETLTKDILCDPKIGDSDFLSDLTPNQTIFGWIHAMQSERITSQIVSSGATAIAWENMNEDNQHTFWRNNELAGEAAVLHAYNLAGQMPYETKVALIGRGSVAFGALRVLQGLGAHVTVFRRNQEELFHEEIGDFDVVVNATLWDPNRKDHLISRQDLKKMKPHAMIIDVSADAGGGIETSHITNFSNPTYIVDGITHYVVDHTPSMLYKTASRSISKAITPFLDDLITSKPNYTLNEATIIKNGIVVNKEILDYQNSLEFQHN